MDLSKLPRMSDSTQPPRPAPEGPPQTPVPPLVAQPVRPAIPKMEAFFSIFVGLILLFGFPRFFMYVFNRADFDANYMYTVPYTQSYDFVADIGCACFGIMLIVDGLIIAIAPRVPLLVLALSLSIAATVYNLFVVIHNYSYGFEIINALAVGFGVYIAAYQWATLKIARGWGRNAIG